MKKQFLLIGLFSVVLAGCNLLPPVSNTDNTNRATQSSSSSTVYYPLIDEICTTAKKNKVRANEQYKGKLISAQGKFLLGQNNDPRISFDNGEFHVVMGINKSQKWKQYDKGQIVDSGNVKVKSITIQNYLGDKDYCYIL